MQVAWQTELKGAESPCEVQDAALGGRQEADRHLCLPWWVSSKKTPINEFLHCPHLFRRELGTRLKPILE